jgi:hypothetical protein
VIPPFFSNPGEGRNNLDLGCFFDMKKYGMEPFGIV